jgi:hypothetical protein
VLGFGKEARLERAVVWSRASGFAKRTPMPTDHTVLTLVARVLDRAHSVASRRRALSHLDTLLKRLLTISATWALPNGRNMRLSYQQRKGTPGRWICL